MCAKHASSKFHNAVIHTVDTDICIYAPFFALKLALNLFITNGKDFHDIQDFIEILGESVCKALPALHAFTGNDYTSSFNWIGKAKPFKILLKKEKYQVIIVHVIIVYERLRFCFKRF